jgi:hypothetical protein
MVGVNVGTALTHTRSRLTALGKSGDESRAVQTLARVGGDLRRREAFGVRSALAPLWEVAGGRNHKTKNYDQTKTQIPCPVRAAAGTARRA